MRTFSETEWAIKYNFQKLMEILLDESDIERLSAIFGINIDSIKILLKEFQDNNKLAARELSKQIPLQEKNKDICKTVVFVGDSNTADRESYFYILQEFFSSYRSIKLINSAQYGWRSNNFFDAFYNYVLVFKPNTVSFMLGSNDMRKTRDEYGFNNIAISEYETKMRYMVRKVSEMDVKVILNTIPPVNCAVFEKENGVRNLTYSENDYTLYNEALIRIANESGVRINNMMPAYAKENMDAFLMSDGIHLSLYGQSLLAKHLAPMLMDAMDT